MRIIAGKWAGRHLTPPGDRRVRPTSEPVREVWLRRLEDSLPQARVLDLFAGTGALGLEAMSRGARYADFVETRPASLHALKANIAALRVREKTRIYKRDALEFASRLEPDSYEITFADPPYESRMLDRLIEVWQERRFSRILTVEHALTHELVGGGKRYEFDETAVTFFVAEGVGDE